MSNLLSGKPTVRPRYFLTLALLSCGFILVAHAGIRGPGKYCGVVVFDRWDTCFPLSGPYITYVSDSVKNDLRPYKGKAMQVDASNVFQAENPGDALIRKYELIGPAPDTHRWAALERLKLFASSDFGPHRTPAFLLEIRNTGGTPIEVNRHEAGPARGAVRWLRSLILILTPSTLKRFPQCRRR